MAHPKNPYREVDFKPVTLWHRLMSFATGYALHGQCGEKIYRPFAQFGPGRCARCGSRINEPCMRPMEERHVEFKKEEISSA